MRNMDVIDSSTRFREEPVNDAASLPVHLNFGKAANIYSSPKPAVTL